MRHELANDYNQTVTRYCTDLKECKPMKSKHDELKYIKKAKDGDIDARNIILKSNLRCVFKVASKYRGYGIPLEELISEGNLGLIHAIDKYDIDKDVKFITYATFWIRFYVSDYVKKTLKNNKKHINYEDYDITIEDKNSPIFDSEDENLSISKIEYNNCDNPSNTETNTKEEELVNTLLSDLTERERSIIINYYGLMGNEEKSLDDLSKMFGLTKERIRVIKNTCIIKMRTEVLLNHENDFPYL